ncbi:DUF1837 domain-containing protein [Mesobacillus maritimus]|uniref:HamA C-terminal domain-containing protein n=1 Tax=Mesobacillus maritimus TaxID=1643336 RepID=UPI00384AC3E4
MLETKISTDFLNLFYHEIKDFEVPGCSSKINLFTLRIENNQFTYHQLVKNLTHCIVPFCLSNKELEEFKNNYGIFVIAVEKLRDYESNDGELGEILLFCLLESHLRAPKIMTKMELKTSTNDYVKGSDGVHLLKIDEQNYQLIFGESKLNGDYQKGLYQAFKSINDFITRKNNNINHEIGLINTHLQRESVSEEMYKFLKRIIIPSAADEELNKDNAFGIFVGFDLKLDPTMVKLPNSDFRRKVRQQIKETVEKEINYIEKKINDYNLFGYTFYVYTIPFINLDETRKRVIKNLKVANNDF